MSNFPKKKVIPTTIKVGDCFAARGGKSDAAVWIVMGIKKNRAYCLGVDAGGNVVSTASFYNLTSLSERGCVGHCEGISNLNLTITYNGGAYKSG